MITAIVFADEGTTGVDRSTASLDGQTRPPDRVVVVCGGPEPDGASGVRGAGADPLVTPRAVGRAAGLNRALAELGDGGDDHVLVLDAGTEPAPDFVEHALAVLQDPRVGAVDAGLRGGAGRGLLPLVQHLERARRAGDARRAGRPPVLDGTARLIRRRALLDVQWVFGRSWDEDSAAEDARLALDLESTGWRLSTSAGCVAARDLPASAELVLRQRRRQFLGALQSVTAYGLTPASAHWWARQLWPVLSGLLLLVCLSLTGAALLSGGLPASALWPAAAAVLVLERVATGWDAGPGPRLAAVLALPELAYALLLLAALGAAVHRHANRRCGGTRRTPVASQA